MERTRLLLLGAELEMLELLNEVLGDVGFQVQVLDNIEEINDDGDFRNIVVCDELIGVLDGRVIWQNLKDLTHTAFVLLADDVAGHRIAACLNDGMHEVVCKPFDVTELHARILRAAKWLDVGNVQHDDDGIIALRPSFEGDLEYLGLPDILLNLKQNSRTGELITSASDGEYVFSFLKGELVRVVGPRGLKHRKALFRALRETSGTFAFQAMDEVNPSRLKFENLDNLILQAMQEADEYPLYRERLPPDPVPVALTHKVESIKLPEGTVIQPLLEGLIKSTTIDILVHASPKTDLQAARELKELMDQDVLLVTSPAERMA